MPPQAAPNPISMLMPFAMMFLIFYVLVFRPQQTARRQHQQMLKDLKKHDEVVTAGGMFGTVVNVKTDTVILRVDENARVEVEKSSISRVVKRKEGEVAVSGGHSA
ncbi:MAG: preprotein translocase subunit YajC [Candidatus Omnitrophica bacterium]|nr:preprotein translocase subunit YajC [Candidatus Omnitrophota bacterium]